MVVSRVVERTGRPGKAHVWQDVQHANPAALHDDGREEQQVLGCRVNPPLETLEVARRLLLS